MLKLYIDGAVDPKTGLSGLGITCLENNKQMPISVIGPADIDNHQAEFLVLIEALKRLKEKGYENQLIQIFSDSKMVVTAIEKAYSGNPAYKDYLKEALLLYADFSQVYLQWIPEKQNQGADHLAKQAINKQKKTRS